MEGLRFGSSGDAVRKEQHALQAAGFHVAADGTFGRHTEVAVRDFQRKHGLLPDGIIGMRTQGQLMHLDAGSHPPPASLTDLPQRLGPAIVPPATKALHVPASPGMKQPPRQLTASDKGLRFILMEETDKHSGNVSWPRGHSGVTLGPGYDMKERGATEIASHMRSIGLPENDAQAMATAAGKSNVAGGAQTWVNQRSGWPNLSKAQQMALLKLIVPKYEAIVHRNVHSDLWQYQFDALVSVAYNPARSMVPLARLIDASRYADAAKDILARFGTSPEVAKGLKERRKKEVALFLYGDYGAIGTIT